MKRGTEKLLKFKKLQVTLGLTFWQAKGLLQTLWDFTSENSPSGNIGRFTNEDIAFGLDWKDNSDQLIEALIKEGWIEEHPDHRLTIHHWPDHCEESVHRKLARAHQYFADGTKPKLTRISKEEREEIEKFYGRTSCVPGTENIARGKPQPEPGLGLASASARPRQASLVSQSSDNVSSGETDRRVAKSPSLIVDPPKSKGGPTQIADCLTGLADPKSQGVPDSADLPPPTEAEAMARRVCAKLGYRGRDYAYVDETCIRVVQGSIAEAVIWDAVEGVMTARRKTKNPIGHFRRIVENRLKQT